MIGVLVDEHTPTVVRELAEGGMRHQPVRRAVEPRERVREQLQLARVVVAMRADSLRWASMPATLNLPHLAVCWGVSVRARLTSAARTAGSQAVGIGGILT